jgi:hypothetical protein
MPSRLAHHIRLCQLVLGPVLSPTFHLLSLPLLPLALPLLLPLAHIEEYTFLSLGSVGLVQMVYGVLIVGRGEPTGPGVEGCRLEVGASLLVFREEVRKCGVDRWETVVCRKSRIGGVRGG